MTATKTLRDALEDAVAVMRDCYDVTKFSANGAKSRNAAISKALAALAAADADQAPDEAEEDAALITKLSTMLAEIAITMKGEEAARHRHSYHDLPELVKIMAVELDLYKTIYGDKVPDGWENGAAARPAPVGAVQAPDAVRKFLEDCAATSGGMISGNVLARCAQIALKAAAPAAPIGKDATSMAACPHDATIAHPENGFDYCKACGQPMPEHAKPEPVERGTIDYAGPGKIRPWTAGDVMMKTPTQQADPEPVELAPQFNEAEFDTMVERGTKVWNEVPDGWLEQERGNESVEQATTDLPPARWKAGDFESWATVYTEGEVRNILDKRSAIGQQAGAVDGAALADGYESGTMVSDPAGLGATVTLHYIGPTHGEAAFEAITNIIGAAIASANQKGEG